jgi:hypothetical protein
MYTEKTIDGCEGCMFAYGTIEWTRCRLLGEDVSDYEKEPHCYPSNCPAKEGVLVKIK